MFNCDYYENVYLIVDFTFTFHMKIIIIACLFVVSATRSVISLYDNMLMDTASTNNVADNAVLIDLKSSFTSLP